ncbi:hypothetical protein E2C01_025389 [Portunus trituberculatus]|uniref:Uncharacterized protein n=1 Tax=Portunus trituberculatus TaxID=210409 RepID=A0A5B7EFD5_PORTR|nr:hypothetical protein [Portunus trituberculatus]
MYKILWQQSIILKIKLKITQAQSAHYRFDPQLLLFGLTLWFSFPVVQGVSCRLYSGGSGGIPRVVRWFHLDRTPALCQRPVVCIKVTNERVQGGQVGRIFVLSAPNQTKESEHPTPPVLCSPGQKGQN